MAIVKDGVIQVWYGIVRGDREYLIFRRMEPDKIANWLLIELTRELIDAGFMPNELAPAGLACADEFGFYTCREEPNGSVTLIGQDDTAMHYLGLARNAATASCTVG